MEGEGDGSNNRGKLYTIVQIRQFLELNGEKEEKTLRPVR